MKRNCEFILAVEVSEDGNRTLRPIGRVVRDVVVFNEAVAKGAIARLVAVEPAKLEVNP